MQRVVKACEGFEFWFFMPDTRFGLQEAYSAQGENAALAWRHRDDFRPLPPWLKLPFDVFVPHPNSLPKTPFEALRLESLQVYGRPVRHLESFDVCADLDVKSLVMDAVQCTRTHIFGCCETAL